MRISDWSSDVCSSDLRPPQTPGLGRCRTDGAMTLTIRPATPDDVPTILHLVRELATFERAPDAVEATEAMLAEALFGVHPAAEAVLATRDGTSLGFALFFHNFSTWKIGRAHV